MSERTPSSSAPRITHVFSCPEIVARLASATGAALVAWKQDGVGSALRTVTSKLTEFVNVEDYASTGDVDDTGRIVRAATEIRRRGGGVLWFKHGKAYTVWTSQTASLMDLSGARNVKVFGNGASITTAQVDNAAGASVFLLSAVDGFSVEGLRYTGSNSTLTASTGERFVNFYNGARNIEIRNCDIYNSLCGIQGQYVSSLRNYNIKIDNVYVEKTYYPLLPVGCDALDARIKTVNCGRSYFPQAPGYGHRVWVDSQQGGPFSDCVIKVYSYSTRTAAENTLEDIELNFRTAGRYAGSGNQSSLEACVSVEYQQGDASTSSGIIRNLRVNISADISSAAKNANLFIMRRFTFAGAIDGTSRTHQLRGLNISGTGANCNNLVESGIVLCSTMGGTAVWTGDIINTVAIRDLNLAGSPPNDSIYVNGQGMVAATQSLLLDNVNLDGAYTEVNTSVANIARRAFKSSTINSQENKRVDWTPGLTFGNGSTGMTFGVRVASVVKNGSNVRIFGNITLTAKGSSTGSARISNLPYTVRNNNDAYTPVTLYLGNTTFANQFQAYCEANTTTINLLEVTVGGIVTSLTEADFTNTSAVYFFAEYLTD